MKRLNFILFTLLIAMQAYAGEYSNQLRTDSPQSGRFIAEDGSSFNIADHLRMSPVEVARLHSPGAYPFGAYGLKITTGAIAKQPVADYATLVKLPNLGVQMSVVSSSVNDSAAGTGVRTMDVHYIDRMLNPRVEIVTLNGTTPVLTAADDIIWVQDTHALTVGTPAAPAAAGNITVSYDGSNYSGILAGNVRSESSFRMIPKGKWYFLEGAIASSISATADTNAELYLVASEYAENIFHDPLILMPQAAIGVQNNSVVIDFTHDFRYSPGTIIGVLATANKASTISAGLIGHVEPIE